MTPATTAKLNVGIRWMVDRDWPELQPIEQSCPEPWQEEDYLSRRRAKNCIGMVAEIPPYDQHYGLGCTLGCMVYELHKHHLELLRFVVRPAYRRRSVGTQMIAKLRSKLSSHRRHSLAVNVHEADLGMHLFLRAQGFRAEEVLRVEECYRFVWTVEGANG